PLIKYIRERGLEDWDVVLVSSSTAAESTADVINVHGLAVGLQKRTVKRRNAGRYGSALLVSGAKRRVASRGIEKIGLTEDQVSAARAAHTDTTKSIPDRLFREQRTRPLLMLHLLKT